MLCMFSHAAMEAHTHTHTHARTHTSSKAAGARHWLPPTSLIVLPSKILSLSQDVLHVILPWKRTHTHEYAKTHMYFKAAGSWSCLWSSRNKSRLLPYFIFRKSICANGQLLHIVLPQLVDPWLPWAWPRSRRTRVHLLESGPGTSCQNEGRGFSLRISFYSVAHRHAFKPWEKRRTWRERREPRRLSHMSWSLFASWTRTASISFWSSFSE